RFLFRDDQNRDHTAEFTILGLGQEFQEMASQSVVPNDLDASVLIAKGNQAFTNTNIQTVDYTHEMSSVELNYHVKDRMKQDQLVYQTSGEWVRRATPTRAPDFLFGLQYFDIDEFLNWNAF